MKFNFQVNLHQSKVFIMDLCETNLYRFLENFQLVYLQIKFCHQIKNK